MTLHATPGIIEGAMTIIPEPDGRLSFRVLVGAQIGRDGGRDMIELIISPEHIGRALAAAKIDALAAVKTTDQPLSFPCHIGFSRDGA
jgi:hypothetical protein